MPPVQLRETATEDDVEAVMGVRRGPGQDRYLGSKISHFEGAIEKTGEVNWGEDLLSLDLTKPSRRSNGGRP
jgi:hypothetical protein